MDDDVFQFEAPAEAAPELVLGKKKKKKKKKKDEDLPTAETVDDSEVKPVFDDIPPSLELGSLNKKKKKKDLSAALNLPSLDADGEANLLPDEGDVVDDQVPPALDLDKGKKKKKKKKKGSESNGFSGHAPDSAFTAHDDSIGNNLGDDDGDDVSMDSPTAQPPTSAFSALGMDEDPVKQDEASAVVPLQTKTSKKKKSSVLDPPESADLESADVQADGAAVTTQPVDNVKRPMTAAEKRKAKKERERLAKIEKSKKEEDDFDAILAELGESSQTASVAVDANTSNDTESAETVTTTLATSQKKRNRKKKKAVADNADEDVTALMAELDTGEVKVAEPASSSGVDASVDVGGPSDEIGDLLAELTSDPAPAGTKKKPKDKKKKGGRGADAPDVASNDVDALLAELGGPSPTDVPSNTNEGGVSAGPSETLVGELDDLLVDLGADAPAAKKKSKKKKKKGGAKTDGAGGDAGGDTQAKSDAPPPANEVKKKKKESAALRKMREQREKMLAEEERLRKIQEEEEARILAEEKRREEEAKKKEEQKRRKKEAEKAKKEKKKQEGTLLSKAEKERRRKAELFRKQLEAQGMIPTASRGGPDAEKRGPSRRRKNQRDSEANRDSLGLEGADTSTKDEGSEESKRSGSTQQKIAPVVEQVVPDAWDVEEEEPVVGNVEGNEDGASRTASQLTQAERHGVPGGKHVPRKDGLNADDEDLGNGGDENDSTSDSDDSYDSDDSEYEGLSKAEIAAERRVEALRKDRLKRREKALSARSAEKLRSPVICILGHVDTGKTKILDKIRRTNVQDGEAGGITQQIGATYFPIDAVKKEATKLKEGKELSYNVPSLLIIDTPGHESFTNLRSRGSSLCDIAILVVDIMHGLEPQTRESIDLLKLRKTPFIVALNKIDRIYDWKAQPHNCPSRDALAKQPNHAQEEFHRRVRETKLEFAQIGFNTELYWENQDVRRTVSFVPTSAISGEGIPDLLMLLLALPQRLLTERLMFNPLLEATVLEVKVIEGLGTTIDIILTGGTIHEGDTIVVVGLDGPLVTTIRALLTPHPMKEMRVKGQYLHHKEIVAAQGIKISADGLESAVAGTQLMVVEDPENEDELRYVREEVMKDFKTILTNVDRSGLGVYVQASTLGSLEALLEFLRTSKIPVSGINIGPVHKRDVTKASTMLEKRKEYATILAFDVGVEKEAQELAEEVGVTIFTADIIYHLFDKFTEHMEEMKRRRREQVNDDVVFPSISRILPQHVYNKKDPIVLGVDVLEGILRVGTPLVVKKGDAWIDVGRVASIELNKKQVMIARKGESVAVKIQDKTTEHIMYGRHFTFEDPLVSKMSRSAIDLLKENFRDDLETEDWRLVVKLKKTFEII